MSKRVSTAVLVALIAFGIVCFGILNRAVYASSENLPDDYSLSLMSEETEMPKAEAVFEARFLNMLNHNFVYGDGFNTLNGITDGATVALLDLRDSEFEDYIPENFVSEYIYNMYGISDINFSEICEDAAYKEGYVCIIPKGYTEYSHKIVSVTENEDGSYTVRSEVDVSAHDSAAKTEICETLFVRNEASQFGFNIISSDFLGDGIEL